MIILGLGLCDLKKKKQNKYRKRPQKISVQKLGSDTNCIQGFLFLK